MDRLEKTILKNLMHNNEYAYRVLPFIQSDYFSDSTERKLFEEIHKHILKYKNLPSHESLIIDLSNDKEINASELNDTVTLLNDINRNKEEKSEIQWLIDNTEKFCQDKAVYNAIMESVNILDGSKTGKIKGEIPKLLSDALGVSFNNNIGHDYINDYEARYESYHQTESRISFDLDIFNKITKGGIPSKTLNIALAGVGVGKTLALCHFASSFLYMGHDVLYITMEMSENKISERIDANLLNIPLNDLEKLSKDEYIKKFSRIKNKTQGRLIVKEYPTASASVLHFRALLNDLQLKKKFKPKIIIVDYLNICCSSRIKQGATVNSYTYVKSIAEELRGLAVEFDAPIFSATQLTRSGSTNSDPGMEDTSECIYVNEKVNIFGGGVKKIGDIRPGDMITDNDLYKTTMFVHHTKPKHCICIGLSSGKKIIVSKDHIFPTNIGRVSFNTGLKEGIKLNSI